MIKLTHKAIKELKRLLDSQTDNVDIKLSVVGGGCSGLNYKLDFCKYTEPDKHKLLYQNEFKLFTDHKSFLFIKDIELDFSDGLNSKGFEFKNPAAKRTCGCGTSFNV